MKLQFSLATLLVCMTVLAVVTSLAIGLKVHEPTVETITKVVGEGNNRLFIKTPKQSTILRAATGPEAAWRLALWGPVAITAVLVMLWAIRRLKSRRHTEPPVG
jgi:hypothetical protein